MTKIMIVDDEILVRIGLRSTISWADFGFSVVADAANGEQAIEKFRAVNPDILITDIRMPGMDGIELIKNLKEIKPQLKTVILTNYDNFEYTRQALKLGADEYILKTTLDNQTLLPILQKLQEEINQELEKSLEYEQLQQKAMLGISYLKKDFADRLVAGRIKNEEWQDLLAELGLKWENRYFQLVLIKGRSSGADLAETAGHSLQLIEEITEKINSSLVWESPAPLEWLIIYNFPPAEEANYCRQVVPFNVRQVKSCLKQYLQLTTVAVFSKSCNEFTRIANEWPRLKKSAEYRFFFFPEKELIFPEDISPEESVYCPLGIAEKNLASFIRSGHREQVRQVLDDLFAKVSQYRSIILLRQVVQELDGEISRLSREYSLRLTEIMNVEEQNHDYLGNLFSLPEVKEWFYQKFDLVIAEIQRSTAKSYSFPIKQAISYIEENYAQDINLPILAQKVGLSKNHLCTLFHSETGENFVEYLHRIRIGHACELLKATDLRVSEVGLKVGYNDAKYFTKVFQKYRNCTPSEYREDRR